MQVRTVLQHAWAEMEHDTQYKESKNIPKSIRRKFLSLAGLLEIADREFTAIQREDKELKENVLTELQKDLTRDAMTRSSEVGVGMSTSAHIQDQPEQDTQVRSLLAAGRYQEAVNVYNKKLNLEPSSYTLFLGRARAHFLLGETSLALKDIDQVSKIKPEDPNVEILRAKISDGTLSPVKEVRAEEANEFVRKGHLAIVSGRAEEAFVYYSDAQNLGASWTFTTFHMALASAVAGDLTGADLLLSQLKIHSGTPMEINIVALRAILFALHNSSEFEPALEKVKKLVIDKGDFEIKMSPLCRLRDIEQDKLWKSRAEDIEEVLSALEQKISTD